MSDLNRPEAHTTRRFLVVVLIGVDDLDPTRLRWGTIGSFDTLTDARDMMWAYLKLCDDFGVKSEALIEEQAITTERIHHQKSTTEDDDA